MSYDESDVKIMVKAMNMILEFIIVSIAAFTNWWAWNYIAPTLFYFLPAVYHNLGFWQVFCVLFVWRSVWTVARQPMKVDRKDVKL